MDDPTNAVPTLYAAALSTIDRLSVRIASSIALTDDIDDAVSLCRQLETLTTGRVFVDELEQRERNRYHSI